MPLAVLLAALGFALAAQRGGKDAQPAAPPRGLAEGGCACPEAVEDLTVCGADGVFYDSDCFAACAGVAVADTRDGCAEGCRWVHACVDSREIEELLEGNIFYVQMASPLIAAIVFVSLVCFTLQYQAKVVEARPHGQNNQPLHLDDSGDFEYQWWACADDPATCCFSWWCPGCRAGDTFQAIGFMTYWQVISYWLLCELVGHLAGAALDFAVNPHAPVSPEHEPAESLLSPRASQAKRYVHYLQHFGPLLSALLKAMVLVRGRRRLRARLAGSDHRAPFCQDLMLWTFCSCCAIAQEARQIDSAMGVRVRCCCRIELEDDLAGTVGEPIKVER